MPFGILVAGVVAVSATVLAAGSAQSTGMAAGASSNDSMYALEVKASKAYDEKRYRESEKLYDEALARGLKRPDDAYNAACSAALADDRVKAKEFLLLSVQLGFRDPDHMKTDSDLDSLHSEDDFKAAVAKAENNERVFRKQHEDPAQVAFVLSDIELFWGAFDHLDKAQDRETVLEREYLDRGSVGLQDFTVSRINSAEELLKTIDHAPKYYTALRPASMRIREMVPAMQASFRKLKEIYPSATFPDVYFLVGRMNSGGTVSRSGLLIGAEMFGKQSGVSLAELGEWEQSVVAPVEEIPTTVAHELIHFQQKTAGRTLLAQSIREGSADFVGELISGRKTAAIAFDYGIKHEAEVWNDFSKEMNGKDMSHWLYQSKTVNGRPADLGYFVGYRISQSYYEKASDKEKALSDILSFKDASVLLKESGYADRFNSRQ